MMPISSPPIRTLADFRQFHLGNDPLNCQALHSFFNLVQGKHKIKKLNFAASPLGTEGLTFLSTQLVHMHALRVLSIRTITAEPQGFNSLFKALPDSLAALDISYDRLDLNSSLSLAHFLNRAKNLRRLNLSYCHIVQNGFHLILDSLGRCTNLRILDLSCIFSSDTSFWERLSESLRKIPLQTLLLDHSTIQAAALRSLLPALINHPTLTKLNLEMNPLKASGAQLIAQILAGGISLHSLHLYGCQLGPEGGKALAQGLQVNRSLRFLNIPQNDFDADSIQAIQAAIASNPSLQCRFYPDELPFL